MLNERLLELRHVGYQIACYGRNLALTLIHFIIQLTGGTKPKLRRIKTTEVKVFFEFEL